MPIEIVSNKTTTIREIPIGGFFCFLSYGSEGVFQRLGAGAYAYSAANHEGRFPYVKVVDTSFKEKENGYVFWALPSLKVIPLKVKKIEVE